MDVASSVPPSAPKPQRKVWLSIAKWVLAGAGLVGVYLLIDHTGPSVVWNALRRAAPWLPLVLALEVAWISSDVFSLRIMYGDRGKQVPLGTWIRSGMTAYGLMILLPGGRAGGEVARAAILGKHVGGPRAAAVATRLQAITLLGNTAISVPCLVAAVYTAGRFSELSWLIAGNGLVTLVGATVILAGAKWLKLGSFLGSKISKLKGSGVEFDRELSDAVPIWAPVFCSFVGRSVQAIQYGVLLFAVGGAWSLPSMMVAQGVHLVGAGAGDFVPNQVGVTEGAYALFAGDLGLATGQAVSIALLARLTQSLVAVLALTLNGVGKRSQLSADASAVPSE